MQLCSDRGTPELVVDCAFGDWKTRLHEQSCIRAQTPCKLRFGAVCILQPSHPKPSPATHLDSCLLPASTCNIKHVYTRLFHCLT